MDRTEHKLRLIHSLGELLPMHNYTTEVRAAAAAAPPARSMPRHSLTLGAPRLGSTAPCPVQRAPAGTSHHTRSTEMR